MSILARFSEARRRRLAVQDLKALPAETLLDIGIEPDRVEAAVSDVFESHARGSAGGNPTAFSGPSGSNGAWPYTWRRAG
jgi:uncharacterized protein YjiS (DUF1127 family)